MPGLVNRHDNIANTTGLGAFLFVLFLRSLNLWLVFLYFASHQNLLSYFAFCSIGHFLASLGIYLVTVSTCVATVVV